MLKNMFTYFRMRNKTAADMTLKARFHRSLAQAWRKLGAKHAKLERFHCSLAQACRKTRQAAMETFRMFNVVSDRASVS